MPQRGCVVVHRRPAGSGGDCDQQLATGRARVEGDDMVRTTLRGLTVAIGMVGTLAMGALGAVASPAATPDEGFGEVDCGGEVGTVRIPGYGSRTGFTADGRLYKVQIGTMSGLADTGTTCFGPQGPVTVVRIR
jgi:hypothetical protein